jgi:glycosyltransferase involved in cell wall biosynthesis
VPAISVLMPVYNAAATLPEALASLRAQTEQHFEIVAVDDGSDDGSRALLEAWPDARMRVLTPGRVGLTAALNVGLAACQGALVARMDADDVAHRDRLAAQRALLEADPSLGVASCLVEGIGPHTDGMQGYLAWLNSVRTPDDIGRARFIEAPLAHPTAMLRRQLCDGYREGDFPEDYELWLRLLERGVRFAKVERVLLGWRDHEARATRRDPRYRWDALRQLKLDYLRSGPLGRPRDVFFWGAGTEGKPLVRALAAAAVPTRCIVDLDPRKIGNIVHGARIVRPEVLRQTLGSAREPLVLVAVGVRSARPEIRAELSGWGLREGEDFWFLC